MHTLSTCNETSFYKGHSTISIWDFDLYTIYICVCLCVCVYLKKIYVYLCLFWISEQFLESFYEKKKK